jgi:hypothetical protein
MYVGDCVLRIKMSTLHVIECNMYIGTYTCRYTVNVIVYSTCMHVVVYMKYMYVYTVCVNVYVLLLLIPV